MNKNGGKKNGQREEDKAELCMYRHTCTCTVEPHYNEDLGTMKITLLYQVSRYIRVKKNKEI